MDSVIELAAKVGLALVIVWFFSRMTFVIFWFVQPFLAGFVAGVLVAVIFAIRLKRT